jgi:transposase-like protein
VTELTPDLADAIVASVERGASSFDAAEVNGVSRDTLRRWLRIAEQDATYWPGTNSLVSEGLKSRIAEFAERLTRAKAGKRVVLTSNLLHNATTPNEKTGWYDTQAIDKLMAKDGDNREHWYENKQLTVTQQGSISHEVTTVQQLAQSGGYEALAALEAELNAIDGQATELPQLPGGEG